MSFCLKGNSVCDSWICKKGMEHELMRDSAETGLWMAVYLLGPVSASSWVQVIIE